MVLVARELGGELGHVDPGLGRTGDCPDRCCRCPRVLHLVRNPGGTASEEAEAALAAPVNRHQGNEAEDSERQNSGAGKGDDDRGHTDKESDLPSLVYRPRLIDFTGLTRPNGTSRR